MTVTTAVEGGLFWQQNRGSACTVDRGETREPPSLI